MRYKPDWEQAKEKWRGYWRRANDGRPLMCVVARKPEIEQAHWEAVKSGKKMYCAVCQGEDPTLPDELMYKDTADKYLNAERMAARYRHFCENHVFLAESFPNINADYGPGSMAAYLGSDIIFNDDTVWFEHCVKDWETFPPLKFNPDNKWWQNHFKLVSDIHKLSGGDFFIGMPDVMENIDVLASLRGAENMIFDMMDEPEMVKRRIGEVGGAYFEYYDRFFDLVRDGGGGSVYTVFQIWGEGRTAKLQCDFSAMMSPDNFKDFIVEPLRTQAKRLDNVLYHLDGPDSIKHLDALMGIDEIDALQWTSGDHGPDGTLEDWYVIYDKARAAGKSLWIKVYSGEYGDWLKNADRIVKRYGSRGLFFHFPEMSLAQAENLIDYAEKNWSGIECHIRPGL